MDGWCSTGYRNWGIVGNESPAGYWLHFDGCWAHYWVLDMVSSESYSIYGRMTGFC